MTQNPNQILEATETFITQVPRANGRVDEYPVYAGRTRVVASHELARLYPQYFRPIELGLSYGAIEETTDEPGTEGRQHPLTPPAAVERSERLAKEKPVPAPDPVAPAPAPAESKPRAEDPKPTKGLTTKDLRGGK